MYRGFTSSYIFILYYYNIYVKNVVNFFFLNSIVVGQFYVKSKKFCFNFFIKKKNICTMNSKVNSQFLFYIYKNNRNNYVKNIVTSQNIEITSNFLFYSMLNLFNQISNFSDYSLSNYNFFLLKKYLSVFSSNISLASIDSNDLKIFVKNFFFF